jgi:F-type H+-transporting ATPase subunit beta
LLITTALLSRKIAELGIYPAVDPLDSTSRINSQILGNEHYDCTKSKRNFAKYKQLQDIIAILGMENYQKMIN